MSEEGEVGEGRDGVRRDRERGGGGRRKERKEGGGAERE